MGASASVNNEYAGNVAEDGSKAVQEVSSQGDNLKDVANDLDINVELDNAIAEVEGIASKDSLEGVKSIMESVRGVITSVQLSKAVKEMKETLPSLEGDAIFAAVGASLQSAAEMSAPVMSSVGAAILVLGEHLPYIAVAAGAIGAIIYTFKLSKDYDENVKNVSLWMSSVKDWLMLVASKISRSGAASTIPLFEGLQEAMLEISGQVESWKSKWRITKMLSSTTFERDFTRVKTSVLELKTALRDYLDEETQIRQEQSLHEISTIQVETNEKLASLDDQLVMIREMLAEQAQAQSRKEEEEKAREALKSKTEVKDEDERIYRNIQRAAGVDENSPVKFREFVIVFEMFFYDGSNMPEEQKRGLNIAVDRDQSKVVTKAAWMKFYHQWTNSNIEIEKYLIKIAEENPNLLKSRTTRVKEFAGQSIGKAKERLSAAGIQSADDAKNIVASRLNEMGGKFKFKKKENPPQDDNDL